MVAPPKRRNVGGGGGSEGSGGGGQDLGENPRQKFGQRERRLPVNWSGAPVATFLSESAGNCCPARNMS